MTPIVSPMKYPTSIRLIKEPTFDAVIMVAFGGFIHNFYLSDILCGGMPKDENDTPPHSLRNQSLKPLRTRLSRVDAEGK